MKSKAKTVDPARGVAPVTVATSAGQPGGRLLTEKDARELLMKGSSFEEVAALQLVPRQRLEKIASELSPSEPFTVR